MPEALSPPKSWYDLPSANRYCAINPDEEETLEYPTVTARLSSQDQSLHHATINPKLRNPEINQPQ